MKILHYYKKLKFKIIKDNNKIIKYNNKLSIYHSYKFKSSIFITYYSDI